MAIVRKLKHLAPAKESPHKEVDCTYYFVTDADGNRFLQLDTYGSRERKIVGKKSQSIRFAPEAITQLKELIKDF